jgi:hypothetical protein
VHAKEGLMEGEGRGERGEGRGERGEERGERSEERGERGEGRGESGEGEGRVESGEGTGERGKGIGDRRQKTGDRRQETGDRRQRRERTGEKKNKRTLARGGNSAFQIPSLYARVTLRGRVAGTSHCGRASNYGVTSLKKIINKSRNSEFGKIFIPDSNIPKLKFNKNIFWKKIPKNF